MTNKKEKVICKECKKEFIDWKNRKRQFCSSQCRAKQILPMNRKKFTKGMIPWNKGKGNLYSVELRKKFSEAHKGKNMGKNHPMFGKHHTKEANEKNRIAHTGKKYSKETTEKKLRALLSKKSVKKRLQALGRKFNKHEKFLGELLQKQFPNEYKYTGNGTMMINRKFPDFTNINGQKKVILYNGVYWHIKHVHRENLTRGQIEVLEKKPYEEFGYKVLHIWEDEIAIVKNGNTRFFEDQSRVIEKIRTFNNL